MWLHFIFAKSHRNVYFVKKECLYDLPDYFLPLLQLSARFDRKQVGQMHSHGKSFPDFLKFSHNVLDLKKGLFSFQMFVVGSEKRPVGQSLFGLVGVGGWPSFRCQRVVKDLRLS